MRTPVALLRRFVLTLGLPFGLLTVASSGGGRSSSAGDEPPGSPAAPLRESPPFVLSDVEGDPSGLVTKLDREAEVHLLGSAQASADPLSAARIWMGIVEDDPKALLPARRSPWDFAPTTKEDGLLWPASEVSMTRLARLPAAARALVEARFGPSADRALGIALEGGSDDAALVAAARYPVTESGAKALLLVADRRIEAGRDAEAARHLWRWLRFRVPPVGNPAHVASVVARLFDTLVRLEDERGIAALARVSLLIPGTSVVVGGVRHDVLALPALAMAAARARMAAHPTTRPAEGPPVSPTHVWSIDASDPNLVGGRGVSTGLPSARVAVDGDALYVCDARRVRRVDRVTGFVRWAYPSAEPLPRDFDPAERSRSFELPARDVVTAGPLVLAVLGTPPVSPSATFLHDGQVVHGSHLARETRTRIVALDAADGHAVWWSGRLDEADPVVGAPDAAITSALMVDGDVVHAVVSARRGAVECWLATFDLATGRVRRTTYLARAESGLVLPVRPGAERTLAEERIRGLPRAERPVRFGDEIVVVTGAGFVAGVSAETGHLDWVEALPRSDADWGLGHPPTFSPHNEPVAGFGGWFVAAEDAPFAVALEAGSGRLRWVGTPPRRRIDPSDDGTSDASTDGFVEAPHLLGTQRQTGGRPTIVLAGGARALEVRDAISGALVPEASLETLREFDPVSVSSDAGRPTWQGSSLRCVRGGRLRTLEAPYRAEGRWWERDDRPMAPSSAGPVEGDLVCAGDTWLVVGPERIIAIADADVTLSLARAKGRDGVDVAARACVLARLRPSRGALRAAVAASAAEPRVREQLLPGAVDALLPTAEGIASIDDAASLSSLLALVDALEPPARAHAYLLIFRGLEVMNRDARIADLLDAWLRFGDRALVDVRADGGQADGRVRVRSDLYASAMLPQTAARSAPGRQALERRERVAEAAIDEARALGESALIEAIRRAGGTRAAWFGRFALLTLRIDAGRYADAAATAADLRTSAPDSRKPALATIGIDLGSAAAHGLRALEADLLARAGESEAARQALFDADRDGPALARTLDGGPEAFLARELERWSGGPSPEAEVEGRLELFQGERTPSEQARRDVLVLEPVGPGAASDLDRVIVARGLELEIRALSTGLAVPVTAVDAAFLGAVLSDRETSIPGPGVRIASVVAGAGADRAGLRAGDWILRWEGHDATDRMSLLSEIARTPVGAPARVEALRLATRLDLSVTPGRRAMDDRSPPPPTRAVYERGGTAIVPSRFGLLRIDLSTGIATPVWRSRHPGEVVEALGFAGTHFVLVETSPLGDTTVVALDETTGAERFVTAIEGSTSTPPRVVGSALVVDTIEPTRTWMLDRETGSLRATYARSAATEARASRAPSAPEPATSVDAGGAVWLWREGEGWLSSIDPASGTVGFHHLPSATGGLLPRPLSGGGVVAAAAVSDLIEIFLPDLRAGVEPFGSLKVDGTHFGIPASGALDFLSRVAVGGDCVHIARISTDKRAALGTVEIDRRAARGLAAGDPVNWHPGENSLLKAPSSTATPGRSDLWPVFASLRATLDGAWGCATFWDVGLEGAPGRAVWFEPGDHDAVASIRTESSILYARGPLLVGSRVLVPTDGGYVVVRRREKSAR